jgi:hypothetical protein
MRSVYLSAENFGCYHTNRVVKLRQSQIFLVGIAQQWTFG